MKLNSLSGYVEIDTEKKALIESAFPKERFKKDFDGDFNQSVRFDYVEEYHLETPHLDRKISRICPKCGQKYSDGELFCFKCAVALKDAEIVNVKNIDVKHEFDFKAKNEYGSFTDILTGENLEKLADFNFSSDEFSKIIKSIKLTALKNLDAAIRTNGLDLDDLTILEKIILFTKAFVKVEYKSYGPELGFYRFNTIFVDDRQLDALQITTLLHELTHFLIKEILTQMLCRILNASKTREFESIISFILSYSPENCLIDEYAAHTVEGRFTLIGYQDYSSFLNIQKTIERSDDEIEMLKTIGNSLANVVKDILESFIDEDLIEDIKNQFKRDIMDEPDYSQLLLENCTLLNDVGFFKALEFILVDGFAVAMDNMEKLSEITKMW